MPATVLLSAFVVSTDKPLEGRPACALADLAQGSPHDNPEDDLEEIVADARPADWKPDVDYALIRDSEGNTVLLATG